MSPLLFVDSSAYLSLLNPQDTNHHQAIQRAQEYRSYQPVTSFSVIGEVATVGSMRFDKATTLRFIDAIKKNTPLIITETVPLMTKTHRLFSQVKSKNISWVDCYSRIIMNEWHINHCFTFDHNFVTLQQYALTSQP